MIIVIAALAAITRQNRTLFLIYTPQNCPLLRVKNDTVKDRAVKTVKAQI